MSHFGVLVLLSERPDDATEAVALVLAPYDENREVDEYEKECWCVGREAHSDAIEKANDQTAFQYRLDGTRALLRAHESKVKAAGGDEDDGWSVSTALVENPATRAELEAEKALLDEQWKRIFDERNELAATLERVDARYRQPKPGCDDCGGSGRERTTCNPNGFWDWWTVGGRWAGSLVPDYDPATDPRNFGTCPLCGGTGKRDDERARGWRRENPDYGCNGCNSTGIERKWSNATFDGDVLPVSQIEGDLPFYALVTPDGQWHQRGSMGWFGMSADDMDEETWGAYKRAEVAKHPDAWAVVVDCHV